MKINQMKLALCFVTLFILYKELLRIPLQYNTYCVTYVYMRDLNRFSYTMNGSTESGQMNSAIESKVFIKRKKRRTMKVLH